MNKKLSEVFDVEPVKTELPVAVQRVNDEPDSTAVDDDARFAASNIRNLVSIGNKALEEAFEVAIQSESPRAYEVLSNLLKTVSDMNGQLMDIHGKKKQIKQTVKGAAPVEGGNVTNNAIFVGTASDLSELILNKMKPNEIR